VENRETISTIFCRLSVQGSCIIDLIVKAGVQDKLDENPISSDFYEALDERVASTAQTQPRRYLANAWTCRPSWPVRRQVRFQDEESRPAGRL